MQSVFVVRFALSGLSNRVFQNNLSGFPFTLWPNGDPLTALQLEAFKGSEAP